MSTKIEYLTRLILGVSADKKKSHPGWARDGLPVPHSLPHSGMYGLVECRDCIGMVNGHHVLCPRFLGQKWNRDSELS